ncbi:hypothetical protein UFOVP1324_1, partial [uncultured Caudovirales phage]
MPDQFELGAADYLANPEQPVLPRLKNSLFYGVQQQPEAYAKTREAARAMNVPLGAALNDSSYVNAQRQVENLDPNGMILGTPKTANFLAEPDNAAVAHDDIGNLTGIEKLVKSFAGSEAGNLVKGIGERGGQLLGGLGRFAFTATDAPADYLTRKTEELGIPTVIEWDDKGIRFRHSTEADYKAFGGAVMANGTNTTLDLVKAGENAKLGYNPGTTWQQVKDAPLSKFLPYAMEQGIVSIPDMVAVMANMPGYVAARTGEIGQTRAKNDERTDATVGDLMAALPAATASALLEKIGTHGILGIDEAVAKGVGGVIKETGKAALKEGATEASQEFVEGLGEQVGTKKGVDLGALADRMLAAGVAGAGYGGPTRAVGASIQATVGAHEAKLNAAEQATTQGQTVSDMMSAAQASALRTRDPQTFHDFVASVSQDTPVEKVYVQASDLVDALAQGDPEALKQNMAVVQSMPSVMAQLDDAYAGNSLVEIPVSELLAYTPDSSMAQSLIENLKVDPQGMSMKQAEEFMQTQGEELKSEVAKAIEEGQVADTFQASSDRVTSSIKAQLDQVNRFTPDVNGTYAQLLGAFYTTQAARYGVLPEELAASHPVTFQAAGVTQESLEQSQVDKALPGTPTKDTGQGVLFPVLPVQLPTEADGSVRIENVFAGYAPGALNYAELSRDQVRKVNQLRSTAAYKTQDVPLADLVVTQRTVNPDFKEAGQRKKGDGYDLPAVYRVNGRYVLSDGHHRATAALAEGKSTVEARVYDVDTAIQKDTPQTDQPYYQGENAGAARGAFTPSTNTITLLRNADLSTTLHELGHFYLETMARLASDPNAPAGLREDWNTVAAFLDGNSTPPPAAGKTRLYHGSAPDADVGDVWVSRDLADAKAQGGPVQYVDLTPEELAAVDPEGDETRLELPPELAEKSKAYQEGMAADPATWLNAPVDERRDGHERFARGFELYLREGKAPSEALKGAFQRFKSWLTHVYQSITQLNVEISPEVRGVFDRLLASEQEINRAETARAFAPAFDTRPEGITDQEWEAYQRLGADATADAQDALASRSMRDMAWVSNTKARMIRDLEREAREKQQAVRAEVEAEVYSEPVYAAQRFLRRGITADGSEHEGSHKLDKDAVADIYDSTPAELQDWRKLGFGKYGMLAEGGLDPDTAAELFGFSSGHELTEALLNAAPVKEEIDGRTDQRMMERYGDLKDPQAIATAADEAIHNAARLRFNATQANMAAKAVGKRQVLAEAARDFARDLIGRTAIRNLRPGKFTGAETRAGRLAAQAVAKGDMVTAATEFRNQVINGYAAKATYDAQAEVEKAMRFLKRFQSVATRKGLDPDYRDQIDALLERFDLRTGQSLKDIDKRKSLKAWIEAMQARGLEPVIDEHLVNEAYRKSYRDLTVDEMRGLVDAVKNIAHLGRLKNRLLTAKKDRDFGATRDAIVDRVEESAYKTLPVQRESNTVAARASHNIRGYLAAHRTFPGMIQKMEGLAHKGGVMWRSLVQNKNQAESNEAARRHAATLAMDAIFKPLVDQGGLTRKMFIPEIGTSLSLEGRIAVALNWGNQINRERVMSGEKWTADQVSAILSTLTAEQLSFVNRVHDYLDSYWPEIAAKSRRVSGVEPQRVEPEPYQLHSSDGELVNMRGGYYPIKYNTERSNRSRADAAEADLMNTRRGLYVRAMTRQGHLQQRVESTGRPLRYDLGVAFQHVNEVIHDLAFHEYMIDANRLLGDTSVEAAIKTHYGPEYHHQLVEALNAMALGPQMSSDAVSRGL